MQALSPHDYRPVTADARVAGYIAVLLAGSIGIAVAVLPVAGLFALVPVAILLMANSASFRLAFVVFGGLFTLQSSQDLSAGKVVYLAGAIFASAVATANWYRARATVSGQVLRPLILPVALAPIFLLVTLAVALHNGVMPTAWVRDSATYGLLFAVPVFAVDAQYIPRQAIIVLVLVAAGLLAAGGFMAEWLNRRDLVDTAVIRLVLPSVFLPAALFSYAIANALHMGRWALPWLLLGCLVASMMAITGTRGTLVLTVAVPVIGLAMSGSLVKRSGHFALVVVLATVMFTATAASLAAVANVNFQSAIDRFLSLPAILAGQYDYSLNGRLLVGEMAWRTFLDNPILGVGPGFLFFWTEPTGIATSGSNIDTALLIPAQLGIVGTLFIVAFFISMGRSIRRVGRFNTHSLAFRSLLGYAGIASVWLWSGSPIEDKGFSFGLILLVALALPGLAPWSDLPQRSRNPGPDSRANHIHDGQLVSGDLSVPVSRI